MFSVRCCLVIALLFAVIGCGDEEVANPLSADSSASTTIATLKKSVGDSGDAVSSLQILSFAPVRQDAPAAPSLLASQEGDRGTLWITLSILEQKKAGVVVRVFADIGHLLAGDKFLFHDEENDAGLGSITLPAGAYYQSIDLLLPIVENDRFNGVFVSVAVERDGSRIITADVKEDPLTDVVVIENVLTDDNKVIVSFDKDVTVSNGHTILENVSLSIDGSAVFITQIEVRSGTLVVTAERNLVSGRHTFAYNGQGGLFAAGRSITTAVSREFDVTVPDAAVSATAAVEWAVVFVSVDFHGKAPAVSSTFECEQNITLVNGTSQIEIEMVWQDWGLMEYGFNVCARDRLEAGTYTLSYNGQGGLTIWGDGTFNDPDIPLPAFSVDFTVSDPNWDSVDIADVVVDGNTISLFIDERSVFIYHASNAKRRTTILDAQQNAISIKSASSDHDQDILYSTGVWRGGPVFTLHAPLASGTYTLSYAGDEGWFDGDGGFISYGGAPVPPFSVSFTVD